MHLLFKRSYFLYCVVFTFLTVRLLLFRRGIYGIPDLLIYVASLLLFLSDTAYLVYRGDKNRFVGVVLMLLTVLACVGILAAIYLFIGPEAKPHWQSGEWKW
jgi:hypothetical protein